MQMSGVSPASITTTSGSSGNGILGKDDFLRLLVAQIRHQDPLSPLSNEEYVSQLTQFSMLEQLQNMNSAFSSQLAMQQSVLNSQALELLGLRVTAATSAIRHEAGEEHEFSVRVDTVGDLEVRIRDNRGNLVYSRRLEDRKGDVTIAWDGKKSDGGNLAPGTYSVEVVRVNEAGAAVENFTVFVSGVVEGVDFSQGYAMLRVAGQDVPISSVVRIERER